MSTKPRKTKSFAQYPAVFETVCRRIKADPSLEIKVPYENSNQASRARSQFYAWRAAAEREMGADWCETVGTELVTITLIKETPNVIVWAHRDSSALSTRLLKALDAIMKPKEETDELAQEEVA